MGTRFTYFLISDDLLQKSFIFSNYKVVFSVIFAQILERQESRVRNKDF